MNFDYNEEQQLLADSVRRFLQKDYDFEARRKILASPEGWSARVWSQLAQMGLTGLPFSPDYGGFGGGAVDLMGVMEAFGEALVVEPYLATLMGAQLVARAGSAEPMPGADQAIAETVDFATALVCAEAVGAMKFACDTTLEYLKTRKQFGVPIRSFQALQHRMVDMVISYEQARSMACLACSRVDQASDAAERSRSVSAAKIKIADSARHIGQEAVQLHGGMGMSEELKLSHSFRRLTVAAQQFGDADHHLARFASL